MRGGRKWRSPLADVPVEELDASWWYALRLFVFERANTKFFSCAEDERSVRVAQEPTGKPPTPFFKRNARARMIKEGKWTAFDYRHGRPELKHGQVLHRLVAVVPRCYQSQRGTMLNRQRLGIEFIGQENIVSHKVLQQKAGSIAILPAQHNAYDGGGGNRQRRNSLSKELGKSDSAPHETEVRPRGNAMEVRLQGRAG